MPWLLSWPCFKTMIYELNQLFMMKNYFFIFATVFCIFYIIVGKIMVCISIIYTIVVNILAYFVFFCVFLHFCIFAFVFGIVFLYFWCHFCFENRLYFYYCAIIANILVYFVFFHVCNCFCYWFFVFCLTFLFWQWCVFLLFALWLWLICVFFHFHNCLLCSVTIFVWQFGFLCSFLMCWLCFVAIKCGFALFVTVFGVVC